MALKARKRAPGGGRKPKAPGDKLADRITIRIDRATAEALEAELRTAKSRNHRVTMSRITEQTLKNALAYGGNPRNHALGLCVAKLADDIEGLYTGRSWRKDAFTSEMLQAAISSLFRIFGAPKQDAPEVSEKMREFAADMTWNEEFGNPLLRPDMAGTMAAQALIADLKLKRHETSEKELFSGMGPGNVASIARALDLK